MYEHQQFSVQRAGPARRSAGRAVLRAVASYRPHKQPKLTGILLLWLLGLFSVFLAPAPVKVTEEMFQRFEAKLDEVPAVPLRFLVSLSGTSVASFKLQPVDGETAISAACKPDPGAPDSFPVDRPPRPPRNAPMPSGRGWRRTMSSRMQRCAFSLATFLHLVPTVSTHASCVRLSCWSLLDTGALCCRCGSGASARSTGRLSGKCSKQRQRRGQCCSSMTRSGRSSSLTPRQSWGFGQTLACRSRGRCSGKRWLQDRMICSQACRQRMLSSVTD